MNTPTAPTAPLPSELQAAIDRMDSFGGLKGSPTWKTVKQALIAMQREMDEALEQIAIVMEKTGTRIAIRDATINEIRKQLAASERTCAELKVSVENAVVGMNALSAQSAHLVDENAKLRARAEAAERTNNPTKE